MCIRDRENRGWLVGGREGGIIIIINAEGRWRLRRGHRFPRGCKEKEKEKDTHFAGAPVAGGRSRYN
eukprot:6984752-Prorocentrum_lima.AAC.1